MADDSSTLTRREHGDDEFKWIFRMTAPPTTTPHDSGRDFEDNNNKICTYKIDFFLHLSHL